MKPGNQIAPVGTQQSFGTFDDEFARADHVHNIDGDLYAKISRGSDTNLFDNAEFLISQRSSPTGLSTTICQHDRWNLQGSGAVAANLTSSTSSLPTALVRNAGVVTITTADAALAGSDYLSIQQCVEGYNFAPARFGSSVAQPLILSFWMRASLVGTYTASIRNETATRSFVREFAIDVANTWKLIVLSFPGCTDGTWATTTGRGAIINITFSCSTTFSGTPNSWVTTNSISTSNQANLSATIGNEVRLTGMRLEIGNIYSPYYPRDYATDFYRCRRFLKVIGDPPLRGVVTAANIGGRMGFGFDVPFRASPTVAVTGTANFFDGGATSTLSSISASFFTPTSAEHDINMSTAVLTVGRPCLLFISGASSLWTYAAELP